MAETLAYITDAELLELGIPGSALTAVSVSVRAAAIAAASDVASSYLKKRHTLPLVTWGRDLKRAVAHLAVYDLLAYRGFDPGSESGALVAKRADDATLWLRDVAKGVVEPIDLVDTTPEVDEASPLVSSDDAAGWALPTRTT